MVCGNGLSVIHVCSIQYARVWPKSDGFLIFIFFLLFIISIIAHGFLVRYMQIKVLYVYVVFLLLLTYCISTSF